MFLLFLCTVLLPSSISTEQRHLGLTPGKLKLLFSLVCGVNCKLGFQPSGTENAECSVQLWHDHVRVSQVLALLFVHDECLGWLPQPSVH